MRNHRIVLVKVAAVRVQRAVSIKRDELQCVSTCVQLQTASAQGGSYERFSVIQGATGR
jgi:hypothetical protein